MTDIVYAESEWTPMELFCKRTVEYGQLCENFLSPLPHFIDIIIMLKCTYSSISEVVAHINHNQFWKEVNQSVQSPGVQDLDNR